MRLFFLVFLVFVFVFVFFLVVLFFFFLFLLSVRTRGWRRRTGGGGGFVLAGELGLELLVRAGRARVAGRRLALFGGFRRGLRFARVVGALTAPLTIDLVRDRWGNRENLLGLF